ncbi:hypothetical protein Y1Q_0013813 [Alligator mississippiensis]|uniref:Uncharacterized protein n=1 Tax=Alligator mississippiensis TaxID=8496 RepID=A0A151NFL8_ALLMI|nr:hypothetical protein Y1Q_0013813 [Alligator mississippiensis]
MHVPVQPRCSLPDWEREHGLAAALAPGLHEAAVIADDFVCRSPPKYGRVEEARHLGGCAWSGLFTEPLQPSGGTDSSEVLRVCSEAPST